MKILALESSAKAASVAVSEDGSLIAQYFQASGLTHSRTLLAMAQDILKNLELTMDDMDGVAVSVGPGSFTGIRIGLAAAKGLAFGAGKPLCGVSTLAAMAELSPRDDVIVCPVMDARRDQVYNARFAFDGGRPWRITPDRAISLSDLAAEIKNDKTPHFLLG
ncbi:MAG: tRNA (adenosine(37)-N6)-threonylcarbamoyltransferase complex dimerization subunit type 1 TsaB, partial [Clostridia bacterium]|nr:tRNA (adenosine(37)-N6)-threonylcarbamoyltransferase complex dimerization subunit type 1 TsaB [Clostridia bacterium]